MKHITVLLADTATSGCFYAIDCDPHSRFGACINNSGASPSPSGPPDNGNDDNGNDGDGREQSPKGG